MPRYAEVEGLGTLEFPDDTPDEVIDRTVQRELRAQSGESGPGFLQDMANRFRRGGAVAVGRTAQAIARGGYAIERLAGEDAAIPPEQRPERLRERSGLYRLGEGIVEGAQEAFPTDTLRDGGLAATVAESAGAMVPTILTGAAGRVAAALQYGATAGEGAAQEAVEMGRPELADAAFAATAPVGAVTEGVLGVAPRVFRALRSGTGTSVGKALVRGAARESTQEGLEQVAGNVIASDVVGYDPERPATAGLGMAMAAGAIIGGPLQAALAVRRDAQARGAGADLVSAQEPDFDEFGGMGGEAVAVAGGIEAPPLPDTREAIAEQFRLTLDPQSSRTATLVVPGSDVGDMEVPAGVEAEPTPHGVVFFNPAKVTRENIQAAGAGPRFDARVLGMADSGATPAAGSMVVTTHTSNALDVATQVVPADAAAIEAAVQAQQASVPGGETVLEPASAVQQRRASGVVNQVSESPTEPAVDRWDQLMTRAIDALSAPSGYLYSDPLLIQTLGRPVLRGALVAVRAAYRASRSVGQAVQAGVDWLNQQGLAYDVERFKAWAASHFRSPGPGEPGTSADVADPAGPPADPGTGTPAPTPPAPGPASNPDPDERERKLSPRLQEAEWLTPEVRAGIRNRLYQPTSMLASEAAANTLVAELGPERAERLVFDLSVEMPMAVRGGLAAAIAQEYSKRERTATDPQEAKAWRERNSDYLSRLLPQTTEFGQFINMLRAFTWQTAEGAVLTARRLAAQAADRHLANFRSLLQAARDALRNAHQAAITDTIRAPDVQRVAAQAVDAAVIQDEELRRIIRGRAVEDLEPTIREAATKAGLDPDRVLAAVNQFWGPNPQPAGLVPLLQASGVPADAARTWAEAWVTAFRKRVGELEWQVRQTLTSERTRAARLRAVGSVWVQEREAAAQSLLRAMQPAEGKPPAPAVQELARRVAQRLREQLRPNQPRQARLSDLQLLREAAQNFERYQEVWDAAWAQARQGGLEGWVSRLEGEQPQAFGDARVDRVIREKLRAWNLKLGQAVRNSRQGTTQGLGAAIAAEAGFTPGTQPYQLLRDAIQSRFERLARDKKRREIERILRDQPEDGATRQLGTVLRRFVDLHDLGALEDARYLDAIKAGLGLKDLNPAQLERIRRFAAALAAIPQDQQFRRQEATIRLLNELERIRKPVQWWEYPMAFWYAHILSGPMTQAVNLASNAMNLAGSLAVTTIRNPAALFDVGRAIGRGTAKAWPEMVQALKTGAVTGPRLGEKWGDPGFFQKVDNRWLLPWAMVGRALAAGDLLFFHPASEVRQAVMARAVARREGRSGRSLRQRTTELLANTPALKQAAAAQATREGFVGLEHRRRVAEILQAQRDAQAEFAATGREYALATTFNNRPYGLVGLAAEAINGIAKEAPVVRFVVPFTNIIANVVNEGLNYTPIGSLRALAPGLVARGIYGKEIDRSSWADQQTLADLHAKAAVGTLLLSALAAAAAEYMDDDDPPFWVGGQGPSDKSRRDTLRAAGWIPNSIKIGNRYISYQQTPLAVPLAVLGNTLDAMRYGKLRDQDLWARVAYVGAMTGKSIVQQSYLDGIATLLGAVERPSEARTGDQVAAWATRTGSSLVAPNLLRQIDRAFDPTAYDDPGIRGMLYSQLPFVRRSERPVLNGLGEVVSKPISERFTSTIKPDPVWRELARLEVPVYPRSLQFRGQTLTDDEVYEVVKLAGPRTRQRIERLLAVPAYPRWREDTQRERMTDIIQQERDRAKLRVMRPARGVYQAVNMGASPQNQASAQ